MHPVLNFSFAYFWNAILLTFISAWLVLLVLYYDNSELLLNNFNVFLFSISVLVLVFVVYNRRREAHIKYPGPDDDVRENIINYDDEGGGEDDMTAFDITPLQIPIGGPLPMTAKMPCKFKNLAL